MSRFVLGDNDVVDPASETVLIDNIPAPEGYHNGADLQFGKDGYLYVSIGDGGCDYATPAAASRSNDASRDQHMLLGKVLRITRDGAIPPATRSRAPGTARCNVTGRTTAGNSCQETFAWGLRNPFRMAFDPNAAGTRFFINDVGEHHVGGDRPRHGRAPTTAGTCARATARPARPRTAARRRPA